MILLRIILAALLLQYASLEAHLSADSLSAHPGDTRTFTVVVLSDTATSARIEIQLPEGLTPITASISNGKCGSFGCSGIAQPGATLTMTETVRIAEDAPIGPAPIILIVTDSQGNYAPDRLTLDISAAPEPTPTPEPAIRYRTYIPLTL